MAERSLIQNDFSSVPGSNRNLEHAVKSGVFRNDLFYQLNVVSITMPPLRERRNRKQTTAGTPTRYYESVKEAKKEVIRKALAQSKGNLNEAAALLGINLTYLYRLIRNLNLKSP